MERIVRLFFLIFILCWSLEGVTKDLPRSNYIPVQAQGMGHAYLPMADDNPSALFYQPSALAKRQKNTIDILNIQIEGNADYFSSDVFNTPIVSSLNNKFVDSPIGYNPYVGNQFTLGFGVGGFSFGALYLQKGNAVKHGTDFSYDVKYQLIPAAGYGILLADGVIRLGYTLQWVHEESAIKTVNYSDSASVLKDLDRGSALSHNLGLSVSLPQRFLPALDLVVRNINKAEYAPFSIPMMSGAEYSGGVPESDPMSMDVALSLQPKIYQGNSAHFVLQVTDLTNRSDTPILRRASLGTQLELGRRIRLRFGLSEGYPSLGFGIEQSSGKFDLSWYTVERGDAFRSKRDVRVALQFKMNFKLFK